MVFKAAMKSTSNDSLNNFFFLQENENVLRRTHSATHFSMSFSLVVLHFCSLCFTKEHCCQKVSRYIISNILLLFQILCNKFSQMNPMYQILCKQTAVISIGNILVQYRGAQSFTHLTFNRCLNGKFP